VNTLVEDLGYRFEVPFYPPPRVPTPRNRRLRAALRTVDRAVYGIIAERRRGGGEEDDLLALSWARGTSRPARPWTTASSGTRS
jgi:cytochrome P450